MYGDVGIAEIGSALAVAGDDVLYAHFLEHHGGNFAGESAGLGPMAVFRTHADVGALGGLQCGAQIHIGNADHYVAAGILN